MVRGALLYRVVQHGRSAVKPSNQYLMNGRLNAIFL